ncbi:MAG TPA: 23S rRNA (guanosine(2251)-2'-O)-methyltransferase RlmB [Actinomycetota bacterium]|nr:23S rRNA (guanosine(2251)-2'-O)-methyltransferase RlmB [Actinomycetota bacterium]
MTSQIEGRRPVLEALRSGRPLREVLVSGRGGPLDEIRALAVRRGVPVRDVARPDIDRLARSPTPQGVIALAGEFRYAQLDEVLGAPRPDPLLLVALDGVTDPHNLGAIARSTEAAGGHGVIVPERRSAGVTPVVEKAAAGALAWLPVVRVGNLTRTLDLLKQRRIWVVALDGDARDTVWDNDLATEPLCLVVGAEGRGVSRLVAEHADLAVRIPLSGHVGSLNASVAAGVALFEVSRLRRSAAPEGRVD